MSKCHVFGNHMSRLKYLVFSCVTGVNAKGMRKACVVQVCNALRTLHISVGAKESTVKI